MTAVETNAKIMPMLVWLAAYEASHELRAEVEQKNSEEQQKEIRPLFEARFPQLIGKTSYNESWKLDREEEIKEWEEQSGIEEICNRIANKNSKRINSLMKSEKEAELNLCNAALDVLEKDARRTLTEEQMTFMREKINASGWSYERQMMREFIVDFAKSHRKETEIKF